MTRKYLSVDARISRDPGQSFEDAVRAACAQYERRMGEPATHVRVHPDEQDMMVRIWEIKIVRDARVQLGQFEAYRE